MKVSILTHAMQGNYGGMLQAYALQKTIQRLNVEVKVADFRPVSSARLLKHPINKLKLFIRKIQNYFGMGTSSTPVPYTYFFAMADNFKKKYVNHTFSDPCSNLPKDNADTDVWVVGSDQVWRPGWENSFGSKAGYFLDFVPEPIVSRSIAYAASFGIEHYNYDNPELKEYGKKLLPQFKAISVREDSGITICRNEFGIEAVQMPDPTLLAELSDYDTIIQGDSAESPATPYIAAYILDNYDNKRPLLKKISESTHCEALSLLPHNNEKNKANRRPTGVGQWLCLIRNARFIITDSFHGCVFAIIFNKPFVCLGNQNRGMARFYSLLKYYNLEDRLISDMSPQNILQIIDKPIDWDQVNRIHQADRERGISFLKKNITDN